MYKMLIVDDEPAVRAGLRRYVDWTAYGIEWAGEADDGDVALEMIAQQPPDLVLTDIRMPSMDGITMARRIAQSHPQCKIVFISGHDDADYLKSALKINATDYIFKPVNRKELEAVVRRVVDELDAQRREQQQRRQLMEQLKEGLPLLRERLLLALMTSGAPRRGLDERIAFLGLDLPVTSAYWVIVVEIDDLSEVTASRSERDAQLLWYAVLNIVQELVDTYFRGYVIAHQHGEFVGLLQTLEGGESPDGAEALLALAADIRSSLERYLRLGVTIGISDRAEGLARVAGAYRQAREAADHRWYLGKNRIITMDSLHHAERGGEPALHRVDAEQLEPLFSALKGDESDRLDAALDEVFQVLSRNRGDGLKYGQSVCLQIVLAVRQLLLEMELHTPELEAAETALWHALLARETLGEMREELAAYLGEVGGRIRERRSGKVANLVERVRTVIERQYGDSQLTVAEIAKTVYLSPTYVSLLFKQETGQTINEYLTQVRIERAKALLREPQHKFYDICYAIGYNDPSYFTRLFKKATGLTPSAYREHHG
ncbi:response regulator [Paenibacillus sp. IB182496]|uniref:Response regulator n=1 Tax=Paenibacillus sabuli TaxID=2772509 RepID=A0A927GQY4_9BACL|nr:response regulator [Paenibacillus sabuli]MBD2844863.1 response regulator [Paenibacillus sabuli]